MATTVVNLRKDEFDEYIGRGSVYGNPFTHIPLNMTIADFQVSSRDESIACYGAWLDGDPGLFNRFPQLNETKWRNRRDAILRRIAALTGKRLGCYCKPQACHGDILAAKADQKEPHPCPTS